MKSFPLPPFLAAAAALVALPFDVHAAAFLGLTAGLAGVISTDYSHRYRGLRLPKRAREPRVIFRAPPLVLPLRAEPNRLAA